MKTHAQARKWFRFQVGAGVAVVLLLAAAQFWVVGRICRDCTRGPVEPMLATPESAVFFAVK